MSRKKDWGRIKYREDSGVKNWVLVVNFESDLFISLTNSVSDLGVNVLYVNHRFCTSEYIEQIFQHYDIKAVFLSGSHRNVGEVAAPEIHPSLLAASRPTLAICYSMEWVGKSLGVNVIPNRSGKKEEGPTKLNVLGDSILWNGLDKERIYVHMFHSFELESVPEGFELLASTNDCNIAAIKRNNMYCTQFHPEYPYSLSGKIMLKNFLNKASNIPTFHY